MKAVAWIRHFLGLDLKDRAEAVASRMRHNRRSVEDAIQAFKEVARK